MSEITLCPQCTTRFKVSAEQLEVHDGMVRCGRCQNVFNAREYLQEEEPSPQLSLLIDEESFPATEDVGDATVKLPVAESASVHAATLQDQPDLTPIRNLAGLEDEPATLAQQVQFVDDPLQEAVPSPAKSGHPLRTFIGVMLLLLLTGLATYHFRDALVVKLPGLKPLLVDICDRLDCRIALPHNMDALSIVSSELEADAKLVNVITLHALLHNRAPYAQAWPSLELTLTDARDEVVARRTFHPADYLKNADEQERGIGRNREREIALRLDTSDLRPSGYRLLLFYPSST